MNLSALRQIVGALRGLVFKARDAWSPTSAAVISVAACAIQEIASADQPVERPKAAVRKLGGQ